MCRLSASGVRHCWNDPAQEQDAADGLVLGSVLDGHRQARRVGAIATAATWAGQLRNGMDDASQVSQGNGEREP